MEPLAGMRECGSQFPQYLMKTIQERTLKEASLQKMDSLEEPLTIEVASKGIDLLESTFHEKVEFI